MDESEIPDWPGQEPDWRQQEPLSAANELISRARQEAVLAERDRAEAEHMAWFVHHIRDRGETFGVRVDFSNMVFSLMMPNGKISRAFPIFGPVNASQLLDVEFEKYIFLGNYKAIWCSPEGTIEAAICAVIGETEAAWDRLRASLERSSPFLDRRSHIDLTPRSTNSPLGIRIGLPGSAMAWFADPIGIEESMLLTFTISGISALEHEQAVIALERTANSVLFQLHIETGVALQLERWGTRARTDAASEKRCPEFRFAQTELDSLPLSLYWYGIQMADRPFRFLRLYQSVEFYFPETGPDEVKRAVADIVRDKTFDPASPAHIEKLIAVAGKKAVDEEERLEAVLRKCLTDAGVRQFLKARPDRRSAFSPKPGTDMFPKLNLYDESADLLKSVAKRLYSIRCSIVHGKRNAKMTILVPDSDAAARMGADIELIEYVAQRVLAHHGGLTHGQPV